MTIFNIYRSWELYDVEPKQSLLDWMDKENVEDFSCYRIFSQTFCSLHSI
jgi:hypothetical protein